MSASSGSPPPARDESPRRKAKPPVLEIPTVYPPPSRQVVHGTNQSEGELAPTEVSLLAGSRPTSTTSSLDPYYFGASDVSPPPLPDTQKVSVTPDSRPIAEPVTPARDPASIDRRGLIGVGELATPRWAFPRRDGEDTNSPQPEQNLFPIEATHASQDERDDDGSDSPWTIEAVDGELDEKDEKEQESKVQDFSTLRPLRQRPSLAEESGGEEILYPRTTDQGESIKRVKTPEQQETPRAPSQANSAQPAHPPTSYTSPLRKAKKRTSEEFELDQFGTLVSKRGASTSISSSSSKSKDDKARRHRSHGSSITSPPKDKVKDRRRDSVGLTGTRPTSISAKPERHSRQASAGSSSGQSEAHANRRVNTTDFSHLPPSPSTTSIQQFLKHMGSSSSMSRTASQEINSSPNVAHSLLRGSQEGWSGLDDDATLRKLDGLSGKPTRSRSSISQTARSGLSSHPGTPPSKTLSLENPPGSETNPEKKQRVSSTELVSEAEHDPHRPIDLGLQYDPAERTDKRSSNPHLSSDDHSGQEKTPRKPTTPRSSIMVKRASGSSTNHGSTPTTSSRDSVSTSTAASTPHRHPRANRDSGETDATGVTTPDTSPREKGTSSAAASEISEEHVPPVPPLPKDLSSLKPVATSSMGVVFPTTAYLSDAEYRSSDSSGVDRRASLERSTSGKSTRVERAESLLRREHHPTTKSHRLSSYGPPSDVEVTVSKTPSKKWSFSNALNIKLSASPSSTSKDSPAYPKSPRGATFGVQSQKSEGSERARAASIHQQAWTPSSDAMASAASLASLSSTNSTRVSKSPKSGAGRSSATQTPSAPTSTGAQAPLSPASSIRREQKRLTPSSIPFFRRSSSQSMQGSSSQNMGPPPSTMPSATYLTPRKLSKRGSVDDSGMSSSEAPTTAKKSSVLSLGLPSLLKSSSSRRSLHADKVEGKDLKEIQRAGREAEKEREKQLKAEKAVKEAKERSESRISSLMGRKRGKTLSSADSRRPHGTDTELPPLHIQDLPPATAQRVAKLKQQQPSTPNSSSGQGSPPRSATISRTSYSVASLQKQSDASLRSRTQLPTIAGSPSVASNSSARADREPREPMGPPSSTVVHPPSSSLTKETPTKIPRISSRMSTGSSPAFKGSTVSSRRANNATNGTSHSTEPSPDPIANEFGMLESDSSNVSKTYRSSIQPSPTTSGPGARTSRQVLNGASATVVPRKTSTRESMSLLNGLRKSSTGSVVPASAAQPPATEPRHRLSALSPSKGLKLLSPKISLSATRSLTGSSNHNIHEAMAQSAGSSQHSVSAPSPAPSSVDDDEILADEEMMHCIRRQQAKKLAAGATQQELDDLLKFPEPIPPAAAQSPEGILKSSQVQHLSEYERKEILDYPSVYCIGARSAKKPATIDNSTNNYGYDDDRGDYQVIHHDHLAYRYEVIDTLGKGSFGQVLNCRDHATGESVAIKIIRNKKRFHHQALVEIKILDNLRKWDSEEKHHVIKMTDHFYFRNHLCIAMELLSINLYELIKANGFAGFTTTLIRRFTAQMLMSLTLMRHHRIVHCDLKPENVLLKHPAKSAIKVIDFGSSCLEHEKIYTYIQSRFYRSPEVILGMNYHMAIDMWSLGCILAELYTGLPIFPGENEQEQLSCIMEILGVPDKEFVNRSSRKRIFFDNTGAPRPVVNSKGRRRRPGSKTLAQVLRCNDEAFVDFVAKCLIWDPERRIKPQAALRHPFITAGRRSTVSPSTSKSAMTSSLMSSSKNSKSLETPKKSQISAPTPLVARSTRNAGVPTTPGHSMGQPTTLGSSSRYRSSQQGSMQHLSSRTLQAAAPK